MGKLDPEQLAKADQLIRDQQSTLVCQEIVKLMKLHGIDPEKVSLLQPGPGLTIIYDPGYVKMYAALQGRGPIPAKDPGQNGHDLLG